MPGWGLRTVFAGWSWLARCWVLVVVVLAAGGITLQVLGPLPEPRGERVATAVPPALPQNAPRQNAPPQNAPPLGVPPQANAPTQTQQAASVPQLNVRAAARLGPIADPDPALLEPVAGLVYVRMLLAWVAEDGRMPMQVYAAGFDTSTRRPRVGLLLAGIGLSQNDSAAAIHSLPGGVTVAFSPYAQNPGKLLTDTRFAEHEFLLSIPMEPQGFPPERSGTARADDQPVVRGKSHPADVGTVAAARVCRGDRRAGRQPPGRTVRLAAGRTQAGADRAGATRIAVRRSARRGGATANDLEPTGRFHRGRTGIRHGD